MYSKENPDSIRELFDNIADRYDLINNIISFGTHNYVKNDALDMLQKKEYKRIIDLCTGTGDIALRLARKFPDSYILATDFSPKMIEIVRYKIKGHDKMMTEKADVLSLPYDHNTFDLATLFFGLRNLANIGKALDSIYDILKPEAELLIVDLVKNVDDELINDYFENYMPKLASLFTKDKEAYKYLAHSRDNYPTHNEMMKILQNHKFRIIKRKEYFKGLISLNLAKKFI